jgi:hypothetical protein
MTYTSENRPMTAKETGTEILLQLSEQSFEFVNVSNKEAEMFQLFFCFA